MIRKLTEMDRAACFELIKKQPAENLFIIGDLEAYGFEQDFQEIWGDFADDGKLRAVLLRYNINFIPYSAGSFDVKGFADIINKNSKATQLSGIETMTAAILPYLSKKVTSNRAFHYAKCESDVKLPKNLELKQVQKASIDDVERILDLRSKIPEFSVSPRNPESLKRSMDKGVARTFFIEKDGQMISSASTTAENAYAAMVVAVCTLEEYKRYGYATACLTRLAEEVLQEGKVLCLFYDNPEAGKIYKRLGYVDIGKWTWIKYE